MCGGFSCPSALRRTGKAGKGGRQIAKKKKYRKKAKRKKGPIRLKRKFSLPRDGKRKEMVNLTFERYKDFADGADAAETKHANGGFEMKYNKRKQTFSLGLLFVGLMVTLLFPGTALGQERETVLFQVIWGPGGVEYEAFARLVDRFNAEQDQIYVELQGGDPAVYFDRLLVQAATGVAPDLFVAGIDVPAPLVAEGYLLDLYETDLAQTLPWDDYIPAMQENVLYGSAWYTVPWFMDNTWILYSKSLFAERGLDPSAPPRDWDELRSIGVKFVDGGDEDDPNLRSYGFKTDAVGGAGGAEGWWFLPYAWQAGAEIYDAERDRVRLDDPGVVEALRFLQSGVTESRFIAPPFTDTGALIQQNRLAMWHALPAHAVVWEQLTGEKPGTAMLPMGKERATQVGGWHLYLFDTPRRDATVTFVRWLTERENQAQFAVDVRTIPPRLDILRESDLFRAYIDDNPEVIPLIEQAPYARLVHPALRRAPIANFSIEGALTQAIVQVMLDGAPVESAIAQQQRLLDATYQAYLLSERE